MTINIGNIFSTLNGKLIVWDITHQRREQTLCSLIKDCGEVIIQKNVPHWIKKMILKKIEGGI
jgi:hypothetical protein